MFCAFLRIIQPTHMLLLAIHHTCLPFAMAYSAWLFRLWSTYIGYAELIVRMPGKSCSRVFIFAAAGLLLPPFWSTLSLHHRACPEKKVYLACFTGCRNCAQYSSFAPKMCNYFRFNGPAAVLMLVAWQACLYTCERALCDMEVV